MISYNIAEQGVRALNERLHRLGPDSNERRFLVREPRGAHAIAVGVEEPVLIEIEGHVGFYCGGMNNGAEIVVKGHAGPGIAENMMAGSVRVIGNASQAAGATGNGGLLVIEGDASSRCGISMKGIDIVVGGSVGHMSAFMAQAGALAICGDAGEALGDSIYEARLYVAGRVTSQLATMGMPNVRYAPQHRGNVNTKLTLFFEGVLGALAYLHSNRAATLAG